MEKFSKRKSFGFNYVDPFKFGGVYIIYKVDKIGKEEVVKVGESGFVFKRLANYLTEFKNKKQELEPGKVTKKKVQEGMRSDLENGQKLFVKWIKEENKLKRKKIEKELIDKYNKKYKSNKLNYHNNNR